MKIRILVGLLLAFFLITARPTTAQEEERYASCDLCGYCIQSQNKDSWKNITPPSNWHSCVKCVYDLGPDAKPESGITLKIDESTNSPLPALTGRQFTFLGCIRTDLGSFTKDGAAASVINVLLKRIFQISGVLAFLYLIYGSFIIATSQADPERLAYGKRQVMGAIIGLLFAIFSVFLVNLIANGVLRLPGFGGQ